MLRRMIGLHVRSRRDLLTTIPLLLLVTGVTALHAADRPVELSRIRFRINGELSAGINYQGGGRIVFRQELTL